MAYDKAKWHYDGHYPPDLPPENGATHIGMFLAWAIHRGLEGEELREDAPDELAAVRERRMTGRQFLLRVCDESLTADDLNDDANAFAAARYHAFLRGVDKLYDKQLPSLYHADDTWDNFDQVAALIDDLYAKWQAKRPRAKAPRPPAKRPAARPKRPKPAPLKPARKTKKATPAARKPAPKKAARPARKARRPVKKAAKSPASGRKRRP